MPVYQEFLTHSTANDSIADVSKLTWHIDSTKGIDEQLKLLHSMMYAVCRLCVTFC